MNLDKALAHLARVGVTVDVLRAGNVDPADPVAVRGEVKKLIASATSENAIADMRQLGQLQMALDALCTADERAAGTALAKAIRTDLIAAGVVKPARPRLGEVFEACLAEG